MGSVDSVVRGWDWVGNSPNTGQVFRRCKAVTASPARSIPTLCQAACIFSLRDCYREWWGNNRGNGGRERVIEMEKPPRPSLKKETQVSGGREQG